MGQKKEWKTYEEVATYLLNSMAAEFGLDLVEGKQSVKGLRSGTNWEIDAKGIIENGRKFIVVECRQNKSSKQKQKDLGALAYVINDTGAEGGIVVSHLGLQEGAHKVAA